MPLEKVVGKTIIVPFHWTFLPFHRHACMPLFYITSSGKLVSLRNLEIFDLQHGFFKSMCYYVIGYIHQELFKLYLCENNAVPFLSWSSFSFRNRNKHFTVTKIWSQIFQNKYDIYIVRSTRQPLPGLHLKK